MSYQVIARKWRPKSFQELVGQDHVAVTLLNALKNDRLPQALLFTGPRGTGKTSSARILAKSLRCPNAKDFIPCNICPSCEDISQGRSIDVIEIDGASNNGVDAIRELRETVGYMPSSGRYKVYIIDEVHMLSTSAFNALLKTLEEPPPHVVFMMATTEVQKIPNTILSRCQRFDFRRIPSRQIAVHLEAICKADGIKVQQEAVWLVARQADGSMRDGQSLLDQVITYCGSDVTLEKVIDVLGLTDRAILLETLTALANRDTNLVLDVIEKIFRAGYDPKIYAQDLLEELRNALMVRLCPTEPARVVDLPDTEIAALATITKDLSDEDIHLLFDMALKGVNDLLRSQDSRVVLEMMLLRMAAAPRLIHLSHLLQGATNVSVQAKPSTAQTPKQRTVTQASSAPARAQASDAQTQSQPQVHAQSRPVAPVARPVAQAARPEVLETASSSDPWARFVGSVKQENGFLGAMLENTHLISNENDNLVLGIPKKMSFLFDKLKDPENIRRIEQFIEQFWGKQIAVDVKLADPKADSATAATPKVQAEKKEQEKKQSVETAVERHPLVRSAQDVFKTQIKSIKETT